MIGSVYEMYGFYYYEFKAISSAILCLSVCYGVHGHCITADHTLTHHFLVGWSCKIIFMIMPGSNKNSIITSVIAKIFINKLSTLQNCTPKNPFLLTQNLWEVGSNTVIASKLETRKIFIVLQEATLVSMYCLFYVNH